jgi:exopolysaccharide biosynthesis polyprenyl glycosylphosphotransferase
MLIKPAKTVLAKRRLINYLIVFESTLLVILTGVAIRVRDFGIVSKGSYDLKSNLLLFAFPLIWLACLSLFGAWDLSILDNHFEGYIKLLKSSFMTFLAFSSASYLFKISISRFVILFSLVGGTILHLILRWIFLRIVDSKVKANNKAESWLVVAEIENDNQDLESFIASGGGRVNYVNPYDFESDFTLWVKEVALRVNLGNHEKVLVTHVKDLTPLQVQALIWAVQQAGAEFLVRDNLGLATAQSKLQYFEGYNWLAIGAPQINDSLRVIKRIFDILVVVPALILLVPAFVFIAASIKFTSKGPVIYTQKRIGQNGKLFLFPKFRTMHQGSDQLRLNVLGRPDQNMAERYKSDPRITKVGRILRRFSLDEFPQLWSVLVGSMSLVGPRPILPEEESQLGDFHFRRHIAKPGLTGIWQVSGRKETTWEERMAFDVRYVQEWSLALDMVLIARTFRAIITGSGSY